MRSQRQPRVRAEPGSGSMRETSSRKWKLTVDAGRDATGQRRRLTRTVRGTRREATRALASLTAEVGLARKGQLPEQRWARSIARSSGTSPNSNNSSSNTSATTTPTARSTSNLHTRRTSRSKLSTSSPNRTKTPLRQTHQRIPKRRLTSHNPILGIRRRLATEMIHSDTLVRH